jgi:hypothetical protein
MALRMAGVGRVIVSDLSSTCRIIFSFDSGPQVDRLKAEAFWSLYRMSNDGLQVRRTFRDSRGLALLRKLGFFSWEGHLAAIIEAKNLSQSSLPIEWR